MAVKDYYYGSSPYNDYHMDFATVWARGTWFVASSSYTLNSVDISVKKFNVGSTPGTVTVSIREVVGNLPGAVLDSTTFNGNDLFTAYIWKSVNLSASLTNGVRYCITVVPTAAGLVWAGDSVPAYTGSTQWYNNVIWASNETGSDQRFRVNAPDPPSKAINPTPSHKAVDILRNQATIAWEDGGGADTYDVYWGDSPGELVKVSSEQAGLSFNLAAYHPLDCGKIHYWRIDSINGGGTTTGDVWSFATIPGVGWEAADDETELLLSYEGEVYIIEPGNTEKKYIYWDPDTSESILQTTDDQSIVVAGNFSVLCFGEDGMPYVL